MMTRMNKNAAIFTCLILTFAALLQAQEPLNYEIPVEAMLIPLFAVDSAGNPVYDLEQRELQLRVNGNPVDIIYFKSYDLETEEKISREVPVEKKEEAVFIPQEAPERMIFIIIDSVFNSAAGLRRSKTIASNLISSAAEGDRFVIIENTPAAGLKHIAGPGAAREHLIKQVDKIVPQRSLWRESRSSNSPLANAGDGSGYGRITGSDGRLRQMEYQKAVQSLREAITRFKYVLKTIPGPKIVFLVSEGISKKTFEETPQVQEGLANSIYTKTFLTTYLFDYLKDIVNAVNRGGSVLYTINPQNIIQSVEEGDSGEMSLRYLAGESGGKYFTGSDVEKIINGIEKATAAYYELAFYIPPRLGNNLEFEVKCKRKGIRVHTLTHSERSIPYHKMDMLQKKVFAHNITTGGSWSRMLGIVTKAETETIKEKNNYIVTVKLPDSMRNRLLDVWLLYIHTTDNKVEMNFESLKAVECLELNVKRFKGKKHFVVIIEPIETICLYFQLN